MVMYCIHVIYRMMMTKVDILSTDLWEGIDKGRLVNDANLSIFSFYYFWHASIFYNSSEMDRLLPMRDAIMEEKYINEKGRMRSRPSKGGIQIIKGKKGTVTNRNCQLFAKTRGDSFTAIEKFSPAERALHYQMACSPPSLSLDWIFREGNRSVLLPTKVVKLFPFWLWDDVYHPTQSLIPGWQCADPRCTGRVFHLGNWCYFCRRVFCCEAKHLVAHNPGNQNECLKKCKSCVGDLGSLRPIQL